MSEIEMAVHPLEQTLYVPYYPKPFIFCLFKSIPEDVMMLLRDYGKVITFSQAYLNRPIQAFQFDYMIIDFREEDHRFYFQRHISRHTDNYHFILYRYSFETNHGIFFHNEIVEFPSRQVNKDEYDMLLLETPMPAPHCLLSLCRYLCK
jgi:hypothetical protein